MKIGIMGALEEEVRNIKHLMEIKKEEILGDRIFFSGNIFNHDITLVVSKLGKVAAAATATMLIGHFNCETLIFTGVAGGVDSTLNVGDIVVADNLYQHDVDARPVFPQFEIPLLHKIFFTPSSFIIEKLENAAQYFLAHRTEWLPAEIFQKFCINNPKVYTGTIASGDQFIGDVKKHATLKIKGKKVLAVEMEGAAMAQVCEEFNIPYAVIRTISDRADHTAHIDFQKFIDEIASHYAEGIICKLLGSNL